MTDEAEGLPWCLCRKPLAPPVSASCGIQRTTCSPAVKLSKRARPVLSFLRKSKGDPIHNPGHKGHHLLHLLPTSTRLQALGALRPRLS